MNRHYEISFDGQELETLVEVLGYFRYHNEDAMELHGLILYSIFGEDNEFFDNPVFPVVLAESDARDLLRVLDGDTGDDLHRPLVSVAKRMVSQKMFGIDYSKLSECRVRAWDADTEMSASQDRLEY